MKTFIKLSLFLSVMFVLLINLRSISSECVSTYEHYVGFLSANIAIPNGF